MGKFLNIFHLWGPITLKSLDQILTLYVCTPVLDLWENQRGSAMYFWLILTIFSRDQYKLGGWEAPEGGLNPQPSDKSSTGVSWNSIQSSQSSVIHSLCNSFIHFSVCMFRKRINQKMNSAVFGLAIYVKYLKNIKIIFFQFVYCTQIKIRLYWIKHIIFGCTMEWGEAKLLGSWPHCLQKKVVVNVLRKKKNCTPCTKNFCKNKKANRKSVKKENRFFYISQRFLNRTFIVNIIFVAWVVVKQL